MSYHSGQLIWERTAESRNRAMDRGGVGFVRPRKLTQLQGEEAPACLGASEMLADIVVAAVAATLSVLAAYGGLSLALQLALGPALPH